MAKFFACEVEQKKKDGLKTTLYAVLCRLAYTVLALILFYRYELQQRGLLHEEDIGVVPDIYSRNQDLDHEVKFLKHEVAKYKEAAM